MWIGSLSNNDGLKSEVALLQTLSRLFSLIRQNLAIFSELNSKRLYRSSEKEEESSLPCRFTSSTKREIRHFQVIVVQWRGNVQKSVMYAQSFCFFNPNLLLFCRSRWRHSRRCLSSFMTSCEDPIAVLVSFYIILFLPSKLPSFVYFWLRSSMKSACQLRDPLANKTKPEARIGG